LETFLTLKAREPVNAVQHAPMATLRFFAENLSPDVVGHIIPEKPDVAANKGEAIPTKRGRHVHTAKVGTWFITTEHRRLGYKPERHLAWIVQLASDHFDELKRRIPGIKADLSLLFTIPGLIFECFLWTSCRGRSKLGSWKLKCRRVVRT
jgi:hypothetical protein